MLVDSTHHAGCGEAGRLSVGFYASISAGNLRATLVDYQKRFSQIDICLKESSRMRLITALRNGALDIAIVTSATAVARKSEHAALERAHFVGVA